MSYRPLAIIGMACRFPGGANNLEAFEWKLKEGEDCVRPVSKERVTQSTLPMHDSPYLNFGYLDQVDRFDHKFFNISIREAMHMDPHQRIMMEVGYQCLESAGYPMETYAGSNTGVIVPGAWYMYQDLFDYFDPTMFSGNTPFSAAGRISRYFNTFGPAYMVDTGCSSTLMGLHMAFDLLQTDTVDQFLICGARIILSPQVSNGIMDMGTSSVDGRTRSFSASASGSGSSEAAAAILVKPLEKAEADGDFIYAVVRSTSSNSNGQESGSLTATSSQAQARMLRDAWKRGGIDPETVNYIEAHGSGTKLGDPIEISGIDMAYRQHTDKRRFVAVSSVKSNVGHTDTLSGFAGLFKAVISLRNRELYANLHFDAPNPFIDFGDSTVYINDKRQPWEAVGDSPLRAGVSSFGFAGNNVHVIVESYDQEQVTHDAEGERLIPLSAKSPKSLVDLANNLAAYLDDHPDTALADVAHTLQAGRSHYAHRTIFTARDTAGLIAQLSAFEKADELPPQPKKLLCLFSDRPEVPDALVERLSERYADFASSYNDVKSRAKESGNAGVKALAFQFAFHRLMQVHGFSSEHVLGLGTGEVALQLILGEINADEAVARAAALAEPVNRDLAGRLEKLVDREAAAGRVLFVEMGPAANLSEGLIGLDYPEKEEAFAVWTVSSDQDPVFDLLSFLYLNAVNVDWATNAVQSKGRRIPLIPYPFDQVRCWVIPPHSDEAYERWQMRLANPDSEEWKEESVAEVAEDLDSTYDFSAVPVDESWTEMQQRIARIWMEVLKAPKVGLDDDFFGLGGHSLLGTMMINRIQKEFEAKLEFKDIFIFSTIRRLAEGVETLQAERGAGKGFRDIEPIEKAPHYPVSNAQRRLWVIWQMDPDSPAYNLPAAYPLPEEADLDLLKQVFSKLAMRHESLRTTFKEVDGEPFQVISEDFEFRLPEIDLRDADEPWAALHRERVAELNAPFDLTRGPLFRATLVRMPEGSVLLFTMHHIVSDAWSMQVLIQDVMRLYMSMKDKNQPAPEPLRVHYKDYADWHNELLVSDAGEAHRAYWLEKFADPPVALELPTDAPRPEVPDFRGAQLTFLIDDERTEKLRQISREQGVTMFMAFFAMLKVLMHKYTGQQDIVLGTPVAGRHHSDLEEQIGFYVNSLPLRDEILPSDTFSRTLEKVKQTLIEGLQHQVYPFDRLVEDLKMERDIARNPLFDIFVALNKMGTFDSTAQEAQESGEGVSAQIEESVSRFDIEWNGFEYAQHIRLQVGFKTPLYSGESIRRMCEHLMLILDQVAGKPGLRLRDIELLQEEERSAIAASLRAQDDDLDVDFQF